MQKIIAAALVMAVAMAAFVIPAHAVRTYNTAYGTPVMIDGVLDSGWNNSTLGGTNFADAGKTTYAFWRFMYDDDYLYFFVEAHDSTIGTEEQENDVSGNPLYYWARNTIQLCLDWGHEGHSEPGNSQRFNTDGNDVIVQINCYGGIHYHTNTGFEGAITRHATVVDREAGTYCIEIAIEFDQFRDMYDFVPEQGKQIGFGVIMCNAPEEMTWSLTNQAFFGESLLMTDWPNQMAYMTLGAKSATTGTVAPSVVASFKDASADGSIDHLYLNAAVSSDETGDVGILFAASKADCVLAVEGGSPLFTRICTKYDALFESGCYGDGVITAGLTPLGGSEGDKVIAVYWQNLPANYGTIYARTFVRAADGHITYGNITEVEFVEGGSELPLA